MSSACRSCGEYFKIANGQAVANKPAPLNPFGNKAPTPAAINHREPTPPAETEPVAKVEEPPTPDHAKHGPEIIRSKATEPTTFEKGHNKDSKRDIECLECGVPQRIHGNPPNTPCTNCGKSIPLKNFVINEDWSFRIQTQGDVLVESKGHLRGAIVQCYDLTIRGNFDGGADCTGELRLFTSASISGRLRCKRLIIGKRADLKLTHPATADEIVVKGTVIGDLDCAGRVILHEDAIVEGDIKTGSLTIEPGAKHKGLIHMTGLSIAQQVSDAMAEED